MNALQGAIDSARELVELEHRKIKLLEELLRLLLIAQLLGVPPKDLNGKVGTRIDDDDMRPIQRWRGMRLVITRDGVEAVNIPLVKAPHELWPAPVLHAYKNWLAAQEKIYITQR